MGKLQAALQRALNKSAKKSNSSTNENLDEDEELDDDGVASETGETLDETDANEDLDETDANEDLDETDANEDLDETDANEDLDEADANEDLDEDDDSNKKPDAATKRERNRCVAIIAHANADVQPDLTASLLADGTSKSRSVKILNALQGGGKQSLAARINASQKNKKPGSDAPKAKGRAGSTMNARMAARTAAALKRK